MGPGHELGRRILDNEQGRSSSALKNEKIPVHLYLRVNFPYKVAIMKTDFRAYPTPVTAAAKLERWRPFALTLRAFLYK